MSPVKIASKLTVAWGWESAASAAQLRTTIALIHDNAKLSRMRAEITAEKNALENEATRENARAPSRDKHISTAVHKRFYSVWSMHTCGITPWPSLRECCAYSHPS